MTRTKRQELVVCKNVINRRLAPLTPEWRRPAIAVAGRFWGGRQLDFCGGHLGYWPSLGNVDP